METFAIVAAVASAAITAIGTIQQGNAEKAAAEYRASQLKRKSNQELAASQREAQEQRRATELVLSRQQAVAASSGLSASDTTMLDLAGDVAQQGDYKERAIIYGGLDRMDALRAQAAGERFSGKMAKKGAMLSAAGGLLRDASSIASNYK